MTTSAAFDIFGGDVFPIASRNVIA